MKMLSCLSSGRSKPGLIFLTGDINTFRTNQSRKIVGNTYLAHCRRSMDSCARTFEVSIQSPFVVYFHTFPPYLSAFHEFSFAHFVLQLMISKISGRASMIIISKSSRQTQENRKWPSSRLSLSRKPSSSWSRARSTIASKVKENKAKHHPF